MKIQIATGGCLLLFSTICGAIFSVSDPVPHVQAWETNAVARVCLQSFENTSAVRVVEYFTEDAWKWTRPARAGIHYVAQSGTITFAPGETEACVEIPLMARGLVERSANFRIVLTNFATLLRMRENNAGFFNGDAVWVGIEGAGVPSLVDPSFVPDALAIGDPVAEMPDGRILLNSWYGMLMLLPDGSVDHSFAAANREFLQLLPDGKILAYEYHDSFNQAITLLADGTVERIVATNVNLPAFWPHIAALDSGGMLLSFRYETNDLVLRRFNSDGSLDPGFTRNTVEMVYSWAPQLALQANGNILVRADRWNGEPVNGVIRINTDGTRDTEFAAGVNGPISGFFVRRNGKIIVWGYFDAVDGIPQPGVAQLEENGSNDLSGFQLEHPSNTEPWFRWNLTEAPDGKLVGVFGDYPFNVVRWNSDGSWDESFAPEFQSPGQHSVMGFPEPVTSFDSSANILVHGFFQLVDDVPRPAFVRLFATNQPDFRVLTPVECVCSDGFARVTVQRTGPTTNSASVNFATRDGTARAGSDYVSTNGILDFAPFESVKEITLSVLQKPGAVSVHSFFLELTNASQGYIVRSPAAVTILPGLRITGYSFGPPGEWSSAVEVSIEGTVAGSVYWLEASTDFVNWFFSDWEGGHQQANESTLQLYWPNFNGILNQPQQFFRVRRK